MLEALELAGKDDTALLQLGLPSEMDLGTPVHGEGMALETKLRSWIHEKFKELDEQILKPLFGGQSDRTESWVLDARQPGSERGQSRAGLSVRFEDAYEDDDEGEGLSWEASEQEGSLDSRTELSVSARLNPPGIVPPHTTGTSAPPHAAVHALPHPAPGTAFASLDAERYGGVVGAAAAMAVPGSPRHHSESTPHEQHHHDGAVHHPPPVRGQQNGQVADHQHQNDPK